MLILICVAHYVQILNVSSLMKTVLDFQPLNLKVILIQELMGTVLWITA